MLIIVDVIKVGIVYIYMEKKKINSVELGGGGGVIRLCVVW